MPVRASRVRLIRIVRRFRLPLLLRSVVVCGVAAAIAAPGFGQDFDPRGRHHPTRPAHPGGASPPAPRAGEPPHAPPGDAGAGQAALIDRYTKIVLAQPGSPFPLQRLAQLYRDRDGKLAAMVADFE